VSGSVQGSFIQALTLALNQGLITGLGPNDPEVAQGLDKNSREALLAQVRHYLPTDSYGRYFDKQSFQIKSEIVNSATPFHQVQERVQLCRTLADNYSLNVQNNADYFRSMFVSAQTTDELRQLVAQTQERKKFAAMTPLEIKEYNRRQLAQQPEQQLTQAESIKLEAEASGLPPLPGEDQFGNIIDSVYLNRLSATDRHSFAGWVRRYGAANVVARMYGVR
jgi:hypothetical protein